jgi:2-keto-4-pentenoate hydratase/2-oxohepta-3-ene-1,7-dioic acid hydratase in catechol pathway
MKIIGRALIGDTSCYGEIDSDRFHVIAGGLFGNYERNGQSLPMQDIALGAPIHGVRFINVMGGFLEPGVTRAAERVPMWLPKASNFAGGERSEVQMPSALTGPMVMESELALVIGQSLRKASPAEAREAIFGWSVFNDFTAPEFGALGYWAVAKSIDGFASWGPWIRRDLTEERVLRGLAITGFVNGVQVQRGNTSNFAFAPSEIVSHVSHLITLFPGDVIALGTPSSPADVTVGDHVLCEVEGVGALNNFIVADSSELPALMPRRRSSIADGHDNAPGDSATVGA